MNIGPLTYKEKGKTVEYSDQDVSIKFVLDNPKIFGGENTELVADYLSAAYGLNFTGTRYLPDGSHNCPLPGDGN